MLTYATQKWHYTLIVWQHAIPSPKVDASAEDYSSLSICHQNRRPRQVWMSLDRCSICDWGQDAVLALVHFALPTSSTLSPTSWSSSSPSAWFLGRPRPLPMLTPCLMPCLSASLANQQAWPPLSITVCLSCSCLLSPYYPFLIFNYINYFRNF